MCGYAFKTMPMWACVQNNAHAFKTMPSVSRYFVETDPCGALDQVLPAEVVVEDLHLGHNTLMVPIVDYNVSTVVAPAIIQLIHSTVFPSP